MKTKILSIAIIALLLGVSASARSISEDTTRMLTPSEQPEFQADINMGADNVVRFLLRKPRHEVVKLKVLTESGAVIYTYTVRKHKSARIGFDTSKLSQGNYHYIIIKDKKEVMRRTFAKVNSDN